MLLISELLNAGVAAVTAGNPSFSRQFDNIYHDLIPEFEGDEPVSLDCIVHPGENSTSREARCIWEENIDLRYVVRTMVGVDDNEDGVDEQSDSAIALIDFSQEVKEYVREQRLVLPTGGKYVPVQCTHQPLYDYESLRDYNTFISVILVTYKGY